MRSDSIFINEVKLKTTLDILSEFAQKSLELKKYKNDEDEISFYIYYKHKSNEIYKIHISINIIDNTFNYNIYNNIHISKMYNIINIIYVLYILYIIDARIIKFIISKNYFDSLLISLFEKNLLVTKREDNTYKFYHTQNGIYMIHLINENLYHVKKLYFKRGIFKRVIVCRSYADLEERIKEL